MTEPQYEVECILCNNCMKYISTDELPDTIENLFKCVKCNKLIMVIHYI